MEKKMKIKNKTRWKLKTKQDENKKQFFQKNLKMKIKNKTRWKLKTKQDEN